MFTAIQLRKSCCTTTTTTDAIMQKKKNVNKCLCKSTHETIKLLAFGDKLLLFTTINVCILRVTRSGKLNLHISLTEFPINYNSVLP